MDGHPAEIVWNVARVLFGLYMGTAAILAFSLAPLAWPVRLLYGLLSLGLVLPPAAFAAAPFINYVTVAAALACIVIEYLRRAATTRSQAALKASS